MPKILISKAFSFLYFYCFVIDKWHNISGDFEKDISSASSKIIIFAPYLSKYEVQNFILYAAKSLANGCTVQVYTCRQEDEAKRKKLELCLMFLKDAGIKVGQKDSFSQKIAVLDESILWYGSVNFLGYTEKDECCMRIVNAQIASEVEGEVLAE